VIAVNTPEVSVIAPAMYLRTRLLDENSAADEVDVRKMIGYVRKL
jgi:hypothetical protein